MLEQSFTLNVEQVVSWWVFNIDTYLQSLFVAHPPSGVNVYVFTPKNMCVCFCISRKKNTPPSSFISRMLQAITTLFNNYAGKLVPGKKILLEPQAQ